MNKYHSKKYFIHNFENYMWIAIDYLSNQKKIAQDILLNIANRESVGIRLALLSQYYDK